jgi:hypothetical protein
LTGIAGELRAMGQKIRKDKGKFLMCDSIDKLEAKLDSFDISVRKAALAELKAMADSGKIKFASPCSHTNMHFHTFFSFNAEGYSPSKIVWLSKKAGLGLAGMVDFDVLDGLDEFYEAAQLLGLKSCVGMETRVFVPEFSDKVINSPGEPGISYHMGVGFPSSTVAGELEKFKASLVDTVAARNRGLIDRVNRHLHPVVLDYEKDVWPLTPSNNATERHICLAYTRKAKEMFNDDEALQRFWGEKLGWQPELSDLPEGRDLINTIRAKTMKAGGVGYVEPDAGAFPKMADMNAFVLAAGGIPVQTWLNGMSDGEQAFEELLEISMSTGVAAVNIIPDRNYTPGLGEDDEKCKKMCEFVEICQKLDLPIVAGTEMNSPGQKFVDNFGSVELKPFVDVFLKGARIVYAHAVLAKQCGFGYVGDWANENFSSRAEKNAFFEKLGTTLEPNKEKTLSGLSGDTKPQDILKKITT